MVTLRQAMKKRQVFSTNDSVGKVTYLANRDASEK
ncbi:hypothetical protein EPYR_00156 [Erwinia pyrifoliae DSM 12163]|nr:hypothetical protein EPYR_00156 [Erwinia pyrifoliae DSM 12163]